MDKQFCVIVDPLVSAGYLCAYLQKSNIEPIAVLTNLEMPTMEWQKRFPHDVFSIIFTYDKFINKIPAFAGRNIRVLTGYEASVNLADNLAQQLCPQYSNPPETSEWRNDKYKMQERLEHLGLNAIKQLRVNSAQPLSASQQTILQDWNCPVFIKPTQSFCGIGAKRCDSISDINCHLAGLDASSMTSEARVTEAVIQEYLGGDEYFVDTVSLMGQHNLVSIFRYQKTLYNSIPTNRYAEVIDPLDSQAKICINFTKKVLDALQLYNGPAHTEIMLNEKGPFLIEINPRISGAYGAGNQIAAMCMGRHQAAFIADSILSPDLFRQGYQLPCLRLQGRVVLVQTWQERVFKGLRLNNVKSMSSYQDSIILKEKGELIFPPKNLNDSVALILLVNKDRQQLEADCNRIFELEQQGIFYER